MEKYTNNAVTQTATTLNPADTTLALPAGQGARFPTLGVGDWFRAALVDDVGNLEIVKVTSRVSDSLVIERAQEGTTAQYFPTGSIFSHRLTAATLNALLLRDGSVPMTGTASLRVPKGTTAQRPAADAAQAAGIRLNQDTGKFEGTSDGTNWGSLGGGATGGGADEVFLVTSQTITQPYTLPAGKNAVTPGRVVIADGVKVTLSNGTRWAIV